MTLIEIMLILLIHWFADFVLQTHWMATNKSKNMDALLAHTVSYSLIWLCVGVLYAVSLESHVEQLYAMFLFPLATLAAHTLTDYYTSRWTSKLWAKGDIHNFFVVIGIDQVLHYLQLFGLYYIMFK